MTDGCDARAQFYADDFLELIFPLAQTHRNHQCLHTTAMFLFLIIWFISFLFHVASLLLILIDAKKKLWLAIFLQASHIV